MFVTSANLKDVALTASADFVALILVTSGFAKVFRPKPYISALRGYGLIPAGIFHAAAISLPFAEIVAGITLLRYTRSLVAAAACAALLLVFAGAMTINLARGRSSSCGCGIGTSNTSWRLVFRNVALAGLAFGATSNGITIILAVSVVAGVGALAFGRVPKESPQTT